MSYAMLVFTCLICQRQDTGNPHKVPSLRVSIVENRLQPDPRGTREPLCRDCAKIIREKQVAAGLDPAPIAPDAYAAVSEYEL